MNPLLDPERIRRILVLIKHRFLGDAVVATPMLRATRGCFPAAELLVLTGIPAATILDGFPGLDRILTYAPGSGERSGRGSLVLLRSLLSQMRSLRQQGPPDLVLVCDRSLRAAIGARWCGGAVRAGFDTEGRRLLLTHPVLYHDDRPETQCDLDVLRAVAPEPVDRPFDPTPLLFVTAQERERGRRLLSDLGSRIAPAVGIQPGSQHPYKTWPAAGFAAVADSLATRGAVPVLLGGPDEVEAAGETTRRMRQASLDLTGRTTLREAMGVLTHLALFLGNDTGIRHIAAALGIPTVAVFGPTPARKWASEGARHATIVSPTGAMAAIEVHEVLSAAETLLHGVLP